MFTACVHSTNTFLGGPVGKRVLLDRLRLPSSSRGSRYLNDCLIQGGSKPPWLILCASNHEITRKSLHFEAVYEMTSSMGFAVRVRSAGQKYGPTCHQRDRADVTEFVTLHGAIVVARAARWRLGVGRI